MSENTLNDLSLLNDDQRAIYDALVNSPDCAECDCYSFALENGHMRGAFFALLDDGYSPAEAWRKIEDGEVSYVCETSDYFGELEHTNESAARAVGEALIENIYGGDLSQLDRKTLETYFDFEAFGRDVMIEETFLETEDGNVIEVWA